MGRQTQDSTCSVYVEPPHTYVCMSYEDDCSVSTSSSHANWQLEKGGCTVFRDESNAKHLRHVRTHCGSDGCDGSMSSARMKAFEGVSSSLTGHIRALWR